MKLFRFELKKLLLNKRSLIFIAFLSLFYFGVGIGNSIFTFQGENTFTKYSNLAKDVTGPLKQEFAQTSANEMNELLSILKSEHSVKRRASKESISKLNYEYNQYASRVATYHNGSPNDDPDDPNGIEPLQQRISELKAAGKTDTYLYKKLTQKLTKLLDLGEPEFENVILWETLYEGWNGIIILILLFFPLAFLISSVFTKEVTTGMDNLILSSVKGRSSIVFAKIAAASVCSVLVTLVYFITTFIGNFIPYMSFEGASAPVRCLSIMANTQLDMSIFSFALLTVLWVTIAALIFGAIMVLFSSFLKNHATVFGLGILVLLLGIIIEALGSNIVEKLQLLIDFCFINTISVSTIFGNSSTYNIFGFVVPYWLLGIVVFAILAIVVLFSLIKQQKHRTIA